MPRPPNSDDKGAIAPNARGGSSTLNFLCSLLGHRRSRRGIRPMSGTWQSECILCGTRMQRIGPKHWVPLSELPEKGASAF